MSLASVYQPQQVEHKWYQWWIERKLFHADPSSSKPAYSVLMPPPNVTGMLTMGHVLNNTIQDIYVRWHRMKGYEVCWFPGIDHAGIATQSKVEQQLAKEGLTRYDLGREKFLERVWQWKEQYGGIILQQLRALGVSPDWDRTIFTLDPGPSKAVEEVFIRLFDEGLIYRGKRIINWSPKLQSAISDEEVIYREVKDTLYVLKYYLEDGSGYIPVATVRPETIFADVAVAVHPEDPRYQHLVGKKVRIPLTDRYVPVITDEAVDREFGTGALKVTPAHDPLDFEIGQRHHLPMPSVIDQRGYLTDLAGPFAGMERFEARRAVAEALRQQNLIVEEREYVHNVGFSERGGEPIEPLLSDQWFVKMKPLAEKALRVVLEGKIRFFPNFWVKTYEQWMRNIRDWCISRQLWWGHRIPVYYAPDGRYTAAHSEAEARQKLGLGEEVPLQQDPDVLDTWFSSWLWPLTTMGWLADGKTEDTPELRKFLPTNLLVTGPDIIFFWVARMIMATLKFKNTIPFRDVYFTSLLRDDKGRKLSKSLGNSPDPLKIIEKYGADAVRFTVIFVAPIGQDIRLKVDIRSQDIPTMEIGRNFANKLWNATRLLLMKRDELDESLVPAAITKLPEEHALQWILSRLHRTIRESSRALEAYRLHEYARILYDFVWKEFCDWYLEIFKVLLAKADEEQARMLVTVSLTISDTIMKLLHPVMPFLTEELWHRLDEHRAEQSICVEPFPTVQEEFIQDTVEEEFGTVQRIVEEIRSIRGQFGIAPSQKVPVMIKAPEETLALFQHYAAIITQLANASPLEIQRDLQKPAGSVGGVIGDVEFFVSLQDSIDLAKELRRMEKEIKRLEGLKATVERKLNNPAFVQKAPEAVVQREREKLQSVTQQLERLRHFYADLEGMQSQAETSLDKE